MSDEKPVAAGVEEPFLARWSRLKKEAATAPPPPTEVRAEADTEGPALPPIESLTPESDFSAFMQPRVPSELRQAALKKLFADPHFNVMDGLDIYIDDYSRPDPIPASVVSQLAQFRNLWGVQPQEPPREGAETTDAAPSAEAGCASATEAAAERLTNTEGTTVEAAPEGDLAGASDADTMSTEASLPGNSVAIVRRA